MHLLRTLWCPFGLNFGKAADKAAEGYVGSQDKSALVDASTGLERQVEDAGGANEAETVGITEGLIKMKGHMGHTASQDGDAKPFVFAESVLVVFT